MEINKTTFSILCLAVLLVGCNSGENTQPTEVIEEERGQIEAELETFSFSESMEKADLVAEVKIISKLSEIEEPLPKTIYSATIVDLLKGESEILEINIMQQGNSNWQFNDNALFSTDENYILVLKKATDDYVPYENTYWILGEETGMYQVLDKNITVKMALKDNQLNSIELNDVTEKIKNKEIQSKVSSTNEFQALDKKALKEKINKEVK
ncbi:hypothetical protein [Halalkalibacter alkalisediminis]|uniref:Lipoprotein n=1 Tax=Halalkalibacter alkalisediminis TaxID=935616 RepID=A0ABV6NM73_9BACI|nr:hypothetical protein [Halalkalibacter alkalisediminis]